METLGRVQQLSDTKKLVLRKLLENKDIGEDRLLSLEGSNLKVLRQGSPILFVFPATDGSVSYMQNYLPHIPESWGVYGCQTPGLDDTQQPYQTVAELAAHNIREIRRVQPNGPYYIAGNCMGGLPAYEAAKQLQAAGAETALVLHLMPNFNRPWTDLPGADSLQMRGIVDYTYIIERLLEVQLHLPFERLAELDGEEQLEFVVDHVRAGGWLSDMDLDVFRSRIEVYKANLHAMLSYQPEGTFRGTLTILAVGESGRDEDEISPKSPYAVALRTLSPDQIDRIHVDADAGALFDCSEPHITTIGTELRRVLSAYGR